MSGKRIGFVGLGVMGGPMAGHLLSAGHELTVYNRTPSKATPLIDAGARSTDLETLASECSIVFLCVTRSEDVEECMAAMAGAPANTLFVDHSTIAPSAALAVGNQAQSRGHRFVDAPVTGGSMGAQKGQLTIFLGGSEEDIGEAMPYLRSYAKRAERVGPLGSGQMAKAANQIAGAGALLGLCESMSFAAKAGLDLAQMKDLLAGGAGGSWAYENYGPRILAKDWTPGFTVVNQRKDFGYCEEAAKHIGAAIPGVALVDSLLEIMEKQGHGGWTTACMFEALMEKSG